MAGPETMVSYVVLFSLVLLRTPNCLPLIHSCATYLVGSQQHLLTILLLFRNSVSGTDCSGPANALEWKEILSTKASLLAHTQNFVQQKRENSKSVCAM